MRALINCDGCAIDQNQELISDILLYDEDVKSKLVLQQRFRNQRKNKEIEVFAYDSWITLSSFQ